VLVLVCLGVIGAFMPDADRFARGQPMLILNHPPACSVALATVNGALADWMKSGLLVSWLSTVCVLIASYQLFRFVGGSWAALGGVMGFAVSGVFLAFGRQATSDVPFLALWMTPLALTASALHSGALWRWVVAGLVAGCGALTRSTGIVLALLVLAPSLASQSWRSRFAHSAAAAAGLAVPIGAWISLAQATGSPLGPTENYPTLTLAYEGALYLAESTEERTGLRSHSAMPSNGAIA
jgi:4-amino-4-deoxy-L-arabinose transferase-like glycosyltransferase